MILILSFLLTPDDPGLPFIENAVLRGEIEYNLSVFPVSSRMVKGEIPGRNGRAEGYFNGDTFYLYTELNLSPFTLGIRVDRPSSPEERPWPSQDSILGATFPRGYFLLENENWYLLLGREKPVWGPGYQKLLLGADHPSMDMFYLFSYRFPKILTFTSFSSFLERSVMDTAIGPERRYLTGHRLDFDFGKLKFAFSEVVLYGGEGRQPELYYMNPLLLFYGEQYNVHIDDNILWDLEIRYIHKPSLQVYGELLVDDFQYNPEDVESPMLGGIAGVLLSLPDLDYLRIEYGAICAWVYNQPRPRNRYVHHGRIIGSKYGPDADLLVIEARKELSPECMIEGVLRYWRKGENTPFTPYPDVHSEDADTAFQEWFLTGKVTTKVEGGAYITFFSGNWYMKLGWEKAFRGWIGYSW
ncbi:hypothetical protein DRQ16_00155 [bacterium]|nr:MAG: hypothetical protein DRQ16_00155 [bacterium]